MRTIGLKISCSLLLLPEFPWIFAAGRRTSTSHEIFLDAAEIPDGVARAEFVRVACDGDAELRQRVEHLLQHHSQAGGFLESPLLQREQVCSLILAGPQLAGTRIDGRYRLLKLLGSGGMGQVWLAEQIMAENRHVAVKLLNPGVDSSRSLLRFRAELQVLTRLHHPQNYATTVKIHVVSCRHSDLLEVP